MKLIANIVNWVGAAALLAGASAVVAKSEKPDKPADDSNRRICRSIVPVGTRLSTRICRTQAEWDRSQESQQESVLRQQSTKSTQLERAPGPF